MKVTPTQYAKTLYELTEKKSHQEINDVIPEFAKLLAKKNQLKLLPKIIEKFGEIYNKENGIVEAEVITKETMGHATRDKISKFIKDKYKAKEVLINNIVNESLKGGIIIQVGDEVMDGSVSGQLNRLKSSLEN